MFDPWVGKIPWICPVFLPGKTHGQRSLAGYGPYFSKFSMRSVFKSERKTTHSPWVFPQGARLTKSVKKQRSTCQVTDVSTVTLAEPSALGAWVLLGSGCQHRTQHLRCSTNAQSIQRKSALPPLPLPPPSPPLQKSFNCPTADKIIKGAV